MSYYYFIKRPSTYKKSILWYFWSLSLPHAGIFGGSILAANTILGKKSERDIGRILRVESGTIFAKKIIIEGSRRINRPIFSTSDVKMQINHCKRRVYGRDNLRKEQGMQVIGAIAQHGTIYVIGVRRLITIPQDMTHHSF